MSETEQGKAIEQGGFLVFLALVTIALLFVVRPFAAPMLWAALAAIMFQPLYRRMLAFRKGRENQAAILALLIITVAVILPALVIGSMVVEEALGVFRAFREGRMNIYAMLDQVFALLPDSVETEIDRSGWTDLATLRERAQDLLETSVGLIAQQTVAFGSGLFGFVLAFGVGLYVTYFLLRDGSKIAPQLLDALPLDHAIAQSLSDKFLAVVRATIKGSVVVGLVQGALGAITFWIVGMPSALLFGLLMAIFSFLPAVGPAIIWVPVAGYLLATGAVWQGVVVIVSGVVVVGLSDNLLRPLLVGRDTGIPDWIVLVTTLGGIATLGLSGIVLGPLVAGLFLAAWATLAEQRGVPGET